MGFLDAIFSAPKWASKSEQPALLRQATLEHVVLHVTWVKSTDELPVGLNGNHVAGVTRGPEVVGDELHAYISVIQPEDFNDYDRLETLGHECWHALGAMHQPDT